MDTVKEDCVVLVIGLEHWLVSWLGEVELDGCAGCDGFCADSSGKGREILTWRWVAWVFSGTAARNDEAVGEVENLIGVWEDGIART